MLNLLSKTFFLLTFSFVSLFAEQFTDSFRLDGYGNIKMIETQERRDNFMLSGGVQGRFQFTDNMAVTGQLHFREGENEQGRGSNSLRDYDSELKWLYFDYYLKNDITFRAGAFQFPVFKSSETGDIEYTFTWTETPLSFYGVFGCDDFEGIEVLKNFSYENFDFLAQISYGKSNNELKDGRGDSRKGDVDNLIGLTLKTTHDDFILNIGYLQAQSTMDVRNDIMRIEPKVDFSMYALESEIYIEDFTVKLGLIKTKLSNIFPKGLNYYASLEYAYEDFTPYILYAKESQDFKNNFNNPMDRNRVTMNSEYKKKYSVGLRYDYSANVAFKVSYTHDINGVEYSSFDNENSNDTFVGSINVVF